MATGWWRRAVIGRTTVSDPLREAERPDAQFEGEWRQLIRSRLVVLLAVLGVWAVGVEARLIWVQVVEHDHYERKARQQQQVVLMPEAPRGDIVDRNGQVLAYSVESFELVANPLKVKDPSAEARELCAALGDCAAGEVNRIATLLAAKARKGVAIRAPHEMSPNAVIGVRALMERREEARLPPTLALKSRTQRYYPKLDLAAHVVGFVDIDGKGLAGIEKKYDTHIAGVKGRVLAQLDGRTEEMFERVERAPVPGATVELTLDLALQHIAERELRAGIEAVRAASGSVVMLDPFTGEILAQASYPTFNPNAFNTATNDARRNRAIQDTYEPGSTFKIVTASAALNDRVISSSQLIDTNPGFYTFPGRTPIREAKRHNYGVLTFEDVIVKSSNVGAVKAGLQIGAERMMNYIRGFGFLQMLAPDFSGESRGRIGNPNPDASSIGSLSMGYEIGVTPIQVAAAASVVANGGVLIEPRVLKAIVRDGRREEIQPKVLRRVIAPETAMAMTTIMEGVVERGTATSAALDRYLVAGKTGTAQKVVNGRYSDTDANVSFVGFVPSRQPVFTILVVVDTPRVGPAYGGTVAGPIFKRIAEAALQHAGVMPSINPEPPVIVPADRPAAPLLPLTPAADARLSNVGGRPVMPDLRGLTLREALRITSALGLRMSFEGDGTVVQQSPAPGAVIAPSDRGAIQLRRIAVTPVRSGR